MKRFIYSQTLLLLLVGQWATAAEQLVPGEGNRRAMALARTSPLVMSAKAMLQDRLKDVRQVVLRVHLNELIDDERACIRHRRGLSIADKQRMLDTLKAEGLLDESEGVNIPGGLMAGVFPPVLQDGSDCPGLPQAFYAAPGGANGGHHAMPGGLVVHEVFNHLSARALANSYQAVYGQLNERQLTVVNRERAHAPAQGTLPIDTDIITAAPIWHDWAKTFVFQWHADGSEFAELNFGGNGQTDNGGQPGNAKTGAHHILGLAEAMKRGVPPDFVLAVASAHALPSDGHEYKVVNWLRAASILAGVDPYKQGYLQRDHQGRSHLPAVRAPQQAALEDRPQAQPTLLVEYMIHHLSDADFNFTVPAARIVDQVIDQLAPEYGHQPQDTDYRFAYRHPILTFLSAERLYILYSNGGIDAVRQALAPLKAQQLI